MLPKYQPKGKHKVVISVSLCNINFYYNISHMIVVVYERCRVYDEEHSKQSREKTNIIIESIVVTNLVDTYTKCIFVDKH